MNQPAMQGLRLNLPAYVKNARLIAWVAEIAALTEAADIYWCDGSADEYQRLCDQLVAAGTFKKLNPQLRPGSYLANSDPSDVARVEDRTFICSADEGTGRPDQQLDRTRPRCAVCCRPAEMTEPRPCSTAACAGRTLYVVPFSDGPAGFSPIAHIGVELSDSALRRGQHAHR